MNKALIFALALAGVVSGASARDVDSENDWVLLTLGWVNNQGAFPVDKGLLPEFKTKGACQVALQRALQKDARLSHAEGGGNMYLCTKLGDWSVAG
jgi:hypothetical protein